MNNKSRQLTLKGIFLKGINLQRQGTLRKFLRLQATYRYAFWSSLRRRRFRKKEGLLVPIAMALSPTMRCNLLCEGCYARDYPQDNELSLEIIDDLLSSAERMGVFLFVITGGEPLMKEGILEVFQEHKRLLFLMITNGKLLDRKTARQIARARNIVPVVSLEGSREQTDARRGHGSYEKAERAMMHLQDEGLVFGFSAMVTRRNYETLGSDRFIEEMIDCGCTLGFYTEYIPVGSTARWELVLEESEQKKFRERVLYLRRNMPIMVVHLPDDEYDADGRCQAVANGCMHINAQGYVEPCPFTHFASDNICRKPLKEIFGSQFLARLRSSDAVVRRGRIGCALLENREILEDIALNTGARPTDLREPIPNLQRACPWPAPGQA